MNQHNPNAGMWSVRRKSDGKWLSFDGWMRTMWVEDGPGAFIAHSRSEAVSLTKCYGSEDEFEYVEEPGAKKIEDLNNFASLLNRT